MQPFLYMLKYVDSHWRRRSRTMGERPKRRRSFAMGVGCPKNSTPIPARPLFGNLTNIGIWGTTVWEKNGEAKKLPAGEEPTGGWARLFQSWFDHSSRPMMAFDRGTFAILAVNEAAVQHYGYSREEFLKMTIKDIRPSAEVPHLLEAIGARDHGLSGALTGRHQKKDGTVFDVEVYDQRETWGSRTIVLAEIFDVTDRRRAAGPLPESERPYRMLFEFSPDAILVTDETGRITQLNSQVGRLFGYSRSELLGQPLEVLIPERLRDAHTGHRRDLLAGPPIRAMGSGLELCGRRKDGSEFRVDIMLSRVETEEGRSE